MAKHYLEMFAKKDDKYVAAFELKGKDVTMEIEKVSMEEVMSAGGRKEMCPVVKFKGTDKSLVLNKTNGKMIAKLHGKDPDEWIGKKIVIYPTETDYQGDIIECIRIRYDFN